LYSARILLFVERSNKKRNGRKGNQVAGTTYEKFAPKAEAQTLADNSAVESDKQNAIEALKDKIRASLERFRYSSPMEFPKSIDILVSELRELLDQK